MTRAGGQLRRRRDELVKRSADQRNELAMHLRNIEGRLAPIDRGATWLKRMATPARLLGLVVTLVLLLGRRRTRALAGGGYALAGLLLRWRSRARLLSGLAGFIRSSAGRDRAMPETSAPRGRTR